MWRSQAEPTTDPALHAGRAARRARIAVVLVRLLAVAGLVGVVVLLNRGPEAPTFRRLTAADIPEERNLLVYNATPHRNDRDRDDLVLHLYDTTSIMRRGFLTTWLFDLTTDEVVGEVVDGFVDVYDLRTSTVLMHTEERVGTSGILSFGKGLLERAKRPARSLLRRTGIAPPSWLLSSTSSGGGMDQYDYWLFDLDTDQTVYLGRMKLPPQDHFRLFSSPDGSWTLIHATLPSARTTASYLVDMEAGVMRPFPLTGTPIGWWDRDVLLTWTRADGVRLVDVQTGTQTLLVGTAAVIGLLNRAGIPFDPTRLVVFRPWNGGDLYFTDLHQRYVAVTSEAVTSYLVKYHRADGSLELISPNFQFGWSDSFDHRGRYYLYSGREWSVGSDGVFLRDLDTGEERTLVASAGEGVFSAPFFHHERVVYRRTNELWSVNIDGTDNQRLFPPP